MNVTMSLILTHSRCMFKNEITTNVAAKGPPIIPKIQQDCHPTLP